MVECEIKFKESVYFVEFDKNTQRISKVDNYHSSEVYMKLSELKSIVRTLESLSPDYEPYIKIGTRGMRNSLEITHLDVKDNQSFMLHEEFEKLQEQYEKIDKDNEKMNEMIKNE